MALSPLHVREELGFGEHGEPEPWGHKPHLDGAHAREHRSIFRLACAERGPVGHGLSGHRFPLQVLGECLEAAGGFSHQRDPFAGLCAGLEQRGQPSERCIGPPVCTDVGRRQGERFAGVPVQADAAPSAHLRKEFIGRHVECARRQHRPLDVMAQELIPGVQISSGLLECGVGLAQ